MDELNIKTTVDVRYVAQHERYAQTLNALKQLQPGEAILLVNDHDSEALFHQLEIEHNNSFFWNYLQQGPEIWRARIARAAVCHCK
jgi:uncharacterized protein (DUF2249 family)